MTTKKFSAIKLPHPRYSLEVGKSNLSSPKQEKQNQERETSMSSDVSDDFPLTNKQQLLKLQSNYLPRYSHMAQVIEVKKPGNTIPGRVGSHIREFLGSHVVINNVRPELFLRRDFISKFVKRGKVSLSQIPDKTGADYKLAFSDNNALLITMNSKQYRRFGLVAKKVISLPAENFGTKEKCYRIEIDLKDERIMKNNRYQDKMMNRLRRLSSINKVYFRFVPDDKSALDLSIAAANELSVEFFKYVIEEYALDGCEPVPLTDCSAVCQRIERHWLNCAQLHPKLDLAHIVRDDEKLFVGKDGSDKLAELVEIVDWLGYQLLSLDCDMNEIKSNYPDGGNPRVDVCCTQIVEAIDSRHVEYNLSKLFGTKRPEDEGVILRALFLYNNHHEHVVSNATNSSENIGPYSNVGNNSGVVYIQDCTAHGSRYSANEMTVIGMSALAG